MVCIVHMIHDDKIQIIAIDDNISVCLLITMIPPVPKAEPAFF